MELGPGLGALTEFALAKSPHGFAIEKDGRLAKFLEERFPALGDSACGRHGLRCPRSLRSRTGQSAWESALLRFEPDPLRIHRRTQPRGFHDFHAPAGTRGTALAEPRTKEYGALTLLIGRRWQIKYLRTLPGSVFFPAPNVESAIVRITPRALDQVSPCDGPRFTTLVKQGFSQRRKQLRKMLASYALDWKKLTDELGVPETARAEELSLDQWIALTNFVTHGATSRSAASPADAQDVHGEIFDVVDERDQVVRTATRHAVHTGKLLHRAVHIFVFNRSGELFLQRRSRWKDMHPLKWIPAPRAT